MTRKEIDRLRDFVHKHIGPNQTEVVRYLLDEDCTSLIRDEVTLFNYGKYRVHLKEGLFFGVESELYRKMAQVEDQIDYLQAKANKLGEGNFKDKQEVAALVGGNPGVERSNFKLLEKAEYVAKPIEEWLLVPHWVGTLLANKGEAVLHALNQSWWGRVSKGALSMDPVMGEVFKYLKH